MNNSGVLSWSYSLNGLNDGVICWAALSHHRVFPFQCCKYYFLNYFFLLFFKPEYIYTHYSCLNRPFHRKKWNMQYIFEINSHLLSRLSAAASSLSRIWKIPSWSSCSISLTCLADCQLQPPACQESGRSPAPPPPLSLALAVCLTAEVAPWPFPHG